MGFLDKLFRKSVPEIGAPVAGKCVPLSEVKDEVFSQEILGPGVAIMPSDGKVVAPCAGTIDTMFETGHAVSLVADCGAEILIHVGLDTVNLKGQHYTVHGKAGDKVAKGQLLIEFDREAIAAAGYDTITPVIVCNGGDFASLKTFPGSEVAAGDKIITVEK